MGDKPRSGLVNASGAAGIVLYLFAGFIYFVSGLVVPEPWYWGVLGLWVAGIYVLLRVHREARAWTPAVSVAAVLLLIAITALGGWLLGWSA